MVVSGVRVPPLVLPVGERISAAVSNFNDCEMSNLGLGLFVLVSDCTEPAVSNTEIEEGSI